MRDLNWKWIEHAERQRYSSCRDTIYNRNPGPPEMYIFLDRDTLPISWCKSSSSNGNVIISCNSLCTTLMFMLDALPTWWILFFLKSQIEIFPEKKKSTSVVYLNFVGFAFIFYPLTSVIPVIINVFFRLHTTRNWHETWTSPLNESEHLYQSSIFGFYSLLFWEEV